MLHAARVVEIEGFVATGQVNAPHRHFGSRLILKVDLLRIRKPGVARLDCWFLQEMLSAAGLMGAHGRPSLLRVGARSFGQPLPFRMKGRPRRKPKCRTRKQTARQETGAARPIQPEGSRGLAAAMSSLRWHYPGQVRWVFSQPCGTPLDRLVESYARHPKSTALEGNSEFPGPQRGVPHCRGEVSVPAVPCGHLGFLWGGHISCFDKRGGQPTLDGFALFPEEIAARRWRNSMGRGVTEFARKTRSQPSAGQAHAAIFMTTAHQ